MADPGWYSDPYKRYPQRWFDGTKWSHHVTDGSSTLTDPIGTSAPSAGGRQAPTSEIMQSAPIAATSKPSGGTTSYSVSSFLASIADTARERPEPRLEQALGGLGGAIAAVGVVSLLPESTLNEGFAPLVIIVLGLLFAVGVAAQLLLSPKALALRAAGVGAGIVGAIGIAVGMTESQIDRGSVVVTLLLLALIGASAWVLPGFRGRPTMLGLATFSTMFFVAAVIAESAVDRFSSGSVLFSDPLREVERTFAEAGWVLLVASAAYLTVALVLDRRGFRGIATAFVAPALVSTPTAIWLILSSDTTGSSTPSAGVVLLIIVVGVLVCIVGSAGGRRATTWFGALICSSGSLALVGLLVDDGSTQSFGAALVVCGAALTLAPALVAVIKTSASGQRASAGVTTPTDDRGTPRLQ